MKKSTTKRALFLSFVSMFLCFTMLLGTTYAWFTDSVTSDVNTIVAGNLDIELYHTNSKVTEEKVASDKKLFTDIALWEPGAVVYEKFTVKNEGNLALKYEFTLNVANATEVTVNNVTYSFADMLKVAVVTDPTFTYNRDTMADLEFDETLASFTKSGELAGKTATETFSDTYGIVIYWEPSDIDDYFNMNNEHKNVNITVDGSGQQQVVDETVEIDLGVMLVATQLSADWAEKDSFGHDYDKDAIQPAIVDENGATVKDNTGFTINVPREAVADGVTSLTSVITKPVEENIVPEDTTTTLKKKLSLDISIDGIKEGNTAPITVTYVVPGTDDYTGVEVYHNGVKVDGATYDPATRTITFTTTSCSPFAFVLDTGVIVIPESYTNDEAVAMLKNAANGAKIDGLGRTIDLGTADQNKYALSLTKSVSFYNMTLKASGKGQVVIIQGKKQEVVMKNVTVQNTNYSGQSLVLSLNGATSQLFENCVFKGKAYFQGSNAKFVNCSFDKNNNMDSKATNFEFIGCKFTASSAITMNAKAENILIEGCSFSGSAIRIYKGMAQPTNVKLINNTYKGSKFVSPDSGVDYEGWKTAGAWIEEGNVKK